MLLAAGILHAPMCPHDDGLRLDVLSEAPGETVPADDGALNDPPRVIYEGDGTISITTVGYQDCPVLPTRIEESADAALIILGPVPNAHSCGRMLQSYTTVVRVTGLKPRQALSITSGALTG